MRELRLALGLSQQQFAERIGKSYGMVQRYEQKKPPLGKALIPLVEMANATGRLDLAEVFRLGMLREFVSPGTVAEFLTPAALAALEVEESDQLLEMMEKRLTKHELVLLSRWLTYIRSMPKRKVQLLAETMNVDLMSGPVADRIAQDLETFTKEFAEGKSFKEAVATVYGPKKTKP